MVRGDNVSIIEQLIKAISDLHRERDPIKLQVVLNILDTIRTSDNGETCDKIERRILELFGPREER